MSVQKTTLGIIGAGNLASSLIRGLRSKSEEANHTRENWDIYLTDIDTEKTARLAAAYNAFAVPLPELAAKASVIILAVKPNNMPELIEHLTGLLPDRSKQHRNQHDQAVQPVQSTQTVQPALLFISVAAGLSLKYYEERLPAQAIIRALPNTSALVGKSVTGLVRGCHANDAHVLQAEHIFRTLGQILWLDDNKINALTAVSGSGPAYFYYLAEAMTQAGQNLGLTSAEATFLAAHTLIGAGRMLEETGEAPADLRAKVTSPNGTTHAALESMRHDGFAELVRRALTACRDRGEEMERELTAKESSS